MPKRKYSIGETHEEDESKNDADDKKISTLATPIDLHAEDLWNNIMQYSENELTQYVKKRGWHKVTFVQPGSSTNFDELLDNLLKCSIIPIALNNLGHVISFYLTSINLIYIWKGKFQVHPSITIAFNVKPPFEMQVEKLASTVLAKRFNSTTGILNLSNLVNDHEFPLYLPLSNMMCQKNIISILKDMNILVHVKAIDLSSNNISEILRFVLSGCKHLVRMDLSSNMISNLKALEALNTIKLKELCLDNNPLCTLFVDGYNYTKEIKAIIPTLEKLDGLEIMEFQKIAICKHNYFTINENAHNIVDQFLSTFYTIYDSPNRIKLMEYYREISLFSLTSHFDVSALAKTEIPNSEIAPYKNVQRNILKTSNMSSFHKKGSRGAVDVINLLQSLPATDHDPRSFTVDVISHMASLTTFVVGGVFRHNAKAVFRFSRTFTVKAISYDRFSIMNELLHICCASEKDIDNSFKEKLRKNGELYLVDPSVDDENKLIQIFAHLSGLSKLYARRRLVESKWDIKKALETFIDDIKKDDKMLVGLKLD